MGKYDLGLIAFISVSETSSLLSLGSMIDSECQQHTSTFLACRSLAGHTSVVAAESVGVSLALDVVVC